MKKLNWNGPFSLLIRFSFLKKSLDFVQTYLAIKTKNVFDSG